MKKVVSLILIACFVLAMVACSGSKPATSNAPAANSGSGAEAAKPAAQKAENTAKRPHKPLPVLKNDRKNGKSAPKHKSKRK